MVICEEIDNNEVDNIVSKTTAFKLTCAYTSAQHS